VSEKEPMRIGLEFTDWELSSMVGAVRRYQEYHRNKNTSQAYLTFLGGLEKKLSEALGTLLRKEVRG
jgi:hypothetical protein